jgi:hypothetical protein
MEKVAYFQNIEAVGASHRTYHRIVRYWTYHVVLYKGNAPHLSDSSPNLCFPLLERTTVLQGMPGPGEVLEDSELLGECNSVRQTAD